MKKFTGIFTSPFDQYKERIGQTCVVLGEVNRTTYDYAECGVMYHIRFDDGTEIEAWPEEVESKSGLMGED